VVLLLAVPFFFLRGSIKRPEDLNPIDRALMRLAAPLQYAASAFARGISGVIGDYMYLVDVRRDNNTLAYENSRLRAKIRQLESAQADNHRLRRLLAMRDTLTDETVSAVVIGKDTTEYFRVFHLAVDHPGGLVQAKMPVIALDGVVGTVSRTAGDRVDVQLTVDSGFGVDVVVDRTGARGFVRGTGNESRYAVRVEYMQRTDEVSTGDLLLTSGVGCRFPKGLPVARVTKVSRGHFGIYQEVEAEPTVDFSRLEEVLIVLRETKECSAGTDPRRRSQSKH
jgi:rod shape-determining protein MreC